MDAECIHVVVAVVVEEQGRVLIAERARQRHQGGLWEFPGGKVEQGESPLEALYRELREEVGIEVAAARPLIALHYAYPDRRIYLDVWRVDRFVGRAHGAEGQPLRWVLPEQLDEFAFPAANAPIIQAVKLPPLYLITPEPGERQQWPVFMQALEESLRSGVRLVQLRAKRLTLSELSELAEPVLRRCHDYGAQVLLNAPVAEAIGLGFDGVHLSSARLRACTSRPAEAGIIVAASCHSQEEIAQAAAIDCDFAVAGPVKPTLSHPGQRGIGWEGFAQWCEGAPMPLYALGGMQRSDLEQAWQCGGQGIAAIRALWGENEG
ncbi:MAG: Nudix family hydrolase [Pseudomonadota bacterium]